MLPLPCSRPDPVSAPNINPPGNRKYKNATAKLTATATSTIICPSTETSAGPRAAATAGTTSPNKASPFGRPMTINNTRMVCTMAMARRSPPSSDDNAITCAMAPGLAPSSADSGSQRCTTRR